MVVFEHSCTECNVTFYTNWVAKYSSNKPNCVNCGSEERVEYTGENYEIDKEENK